MISIPTFFRPFQDFFQFCRYLRRPLILACVLSMSQQLSGINAINYYSAPIFEATLPKRLVDDDPDFPNYMVAVSGMTNLLITIVSIFTTDRLGRRKSEIIGLSGMAVCAFIVGILLSGLEIEDDQICRGVTPTDGGNYASIVFIFLFVAFFSIGPGAIPWLVSPELFTSSPRPKALAIANTINWLCNFIIALAFDPLRRALCGWVFLIFCLLLLLFTLYFLKRLPNIEGKSVHEIVQLFMDDEEKRRLGVGRGKKRVGKKPKEASKEAAAEFDSEKDAGKNKESAVVTGESDDKPGEPMTTAEESGGAKEEEQKQDDAKVPLKDESEEAKDAEVKSEKESEDQKGE